MKQANKIPVYPVPRTSVLGRPLVAGILLIQLINISFGAYKKPSFSDGQFLNVQMGNDRTAHWLKDEMNIYPGK